MTDGTNNPTTEDVVAWGTGRGRTKAVFAKEWNQKHGTNLTAEDIDSLGIWPTGTGTPVKRKRKQKPTGTASNASTVRPVQIPVNSGFLAAFMPAAGKAVAQTEDLQAEKLARFQITQRINEERAFIMDQRDQALQIVHAAGLALDRLDYLEKLNVPGDDGRSVETLQKLLENPNAGAEAAEDRAESQEAVEAHQMAADGANLRVVRDEGDSGAEGHQEAPAKRKPGRSR